MYVVSKDNAAARVYSIKAASIELIHMFIPIPQVKPAKAMMIPAFGFRLPYLKHLAQIGSKTMKLKSPVMLANIVMMVNTNVTLNLLAFFVSSVKKDSRNPLLSIIPTPIKTIMMLMSGAKLAKFDTVVLNICFNPDKLNNDVTKTVVVFKSPLMVLTEL